MCAVHSASVIRQKAAQLLTIFVLTFFYCHLCTISINTSNDIIAIPKVGAYVNKYFFVKLLFIA
jgi:hypothetical protein